MPARKPDHVVDCRTLPQTALHYRLCGDMNPLHADLEVAGRAGFPRPILHGLATYGLAGYAFMEALCQGDPERFHEFDVRFTSPVFPGETLRTELWKEDGAISRRTRVVERDRVVLGDGRATMGGAS